jgi:hypothetical protein
MDGKRRRSASIPMSTQTELIEVIKNDLELGFTHLAEARRSMDYEEVRAKIEAAQQILENIRLYAGRIQDPENWNKIHARSDQLDNGIRQLIRTLTG